MQGERQLLPASPRLVLKLAPLDARPPVGLPARLVPRLDGAERAGRVPSGDARRVSRPLRLPRDVSAGDDGCPPIPLREVDAFRPRAPFGASMPATLAMYGNGGRGGPPVSPSAPCLDACFDCCCCCRFDCCSCRRAAASATAEPAAISGKGSVSSGGGGCAARIVRATFFLSCSMAPTAEVVSTWATSMARA